MLLAQTPLTTHLQERDIHTAKAMHALEKAKEPVARAQLINLAKPANLVPALTKQHLKMGAFTDDQRFIPSGIWATGAPTLWKQAITGQTCLVGVIDSGIDKDHPDLKDKVVIRHDFVGDNKPVSRWNPHGTHVAGTIAANGKIMGMAPNARLADYRVLGCDGSGSNAAITRAIYQATLDGCNIINLSLGGLLDYRPMHAAIQNAAENGVLVVAAVGNEGDGNPATTEISYPGYYHEVCGAGAVQFSTSADEPRTVLDAYFTNTNREVDVAAPGWQVLSTIPGGQYAEYSGTSMASPHVSGLAALLYDKFKVRTQQVAPPDMLFAMVKAQTVDIDELGVDVTTGAGFVTFYSDLPKKRDGQWVFEDIKVGMPEITKAGTIPPVRRSGRIAGPKK